MFCKYCGNQIEEGQVCSCPQAMEDAQAAANANNSNSAADVASAAASQFAEQAGQTMNQLVAGTKGLLKRLVPIFKNPVSEISNMVETNNTSMAIQMIILHTIINTLVSIITLIKTRIELGDYAKYMDIPYVKTILIALLGTIILDFAIAGILHLGTNIIYKGGRSYGNMLILTGCMIVPQSFASVIGGILSIIYAPLGAAVVALGSILGLLFMVCGYINVVKLSEDKKVYALFTSCAIMVIAAGILGVILGQSLVNSLGSLF